MQLERVLLALTMATAGTAVAQDPFVGTWVYNAKNSSKPTITYGIKDLGSDRYALTGSLGETTEIKPMESRSNLRLGDSVLQEAGRPYMADEQS